MVQFLSYLRNRIYVFCYRLIVEFSHSTILYGPTGSYDFGTVID